MLSWNNPGILSEETLDCCINSSNHFSAFYQGNAELWFSECSPGLGTSLASPGNPLKISTHHLRITEIETLGWDTVIWISKSPK